jgi:hypothetical protein
MPYNRHENQELIQAFYKEPVPFQGADPSTARCIFIGLDANFDEHIENSEIFDDVKSYLRDGPEFWRQNEVHHPFLLKKYTGDGRYYHAEFSQIGFTSQHADCVSFVEIVPVPTYGKSDLRTSDMRSEEIKKHLRELSKIIIHGSQRVFISKSVGKLLRASTYFCWLPPEPTPDSSGNVEHLKLWDSEVKKSVYCHTHFARWDSSGVEAKIRERPEIKKLCAT